MTSNLPLKTQLFQTISGETDESRAYSIMDTSSKFKTIRNYSNTVYQFHFEKEISPDMTFKFHVPKLSFQQNNNNKKKIWSRFYFLFSQPPLVLIGLGNEEPMIVLNCHGRLGGGGQDLSPPLRRLHLSQLPSFKCSINSSEHLGELLLFFLPRFFSFC